MRNQEEVLVVGAFCVIVKLQTAKGVSCSVQALDYVGSVTWSPQLQQRLTGAQIPYPVSHELSAGRPVELNLSSKHCTNCSYIHTYPLLTTSPGRQVHIEGFGGAIELSGHTGGDGGDVPVTQGSALEIHIHSDDILHNLQSRNSILLIECI